MNESKEIYDRLWNQSIHQFKNDIYDIDPLLRVPQDTRKGLTLLARLTHGISASIEEFLHEAKLLEPDQYFYPRSDFHVTVLSIITCYEGFLLKSIQEREYIEIISECTKDIPPPTIRFTGITASSSCVIIQGFPLDSNLKTLRETLRHRFKNSDLPHSIDSRYSLKTAHITVMRFQDPLRNMPAFVQLLERYRTWEFGSHELNELEFVFNDWYQRKDTTKILSRLGFRCQDGIS